MRSIPATPELLSLAARIVWFKEPADTLADPVHFLAYLMTYGTAEDILEAETVFTPGEFREALENAPPGVFRAEKWQHWNEKLGRVPVPPMPKRSFDR
jgi:hypothetical protein